MKNFIYYENGWRWFEAEQLPVKPILWDEIRTEKYNNAISALKAKSLLVGNAETLKGIRVYEMPIHCVEDDLHIIEWPGSVEVKEEMYMSNPPKPAGYKAAFLKLPKTKPTNKAIKDCADWLAFCLSIGFKKDALDTLEKIWWEHHDNTGKLNH